MPAAARVERAGADCAGRAAGAGAKGGGGGDERWEMRSEQSAIGEGQAARGNPNPVSLEALCFLVLGGEISFGSAAHPVGSLGDIPPPPACRRHWAARGVARGFVPAGASRRGSEVASG